MSNQKLIQLVYYSISEKEVKSNIISDILIPSRKFNSDNSITGCLTFHNKIFLQLLEGEEKTVQKLYKKIEKDNRHTNVTIIAENLISERVFPNWNMAFQEIDRNNNKMYKFIENIHFYSENNERKTDSIDMFWRMVKHIVK